jgi:hypothetical protein
MRPPRIAPWFWKLMELVGSDALRNDEEALKTCFRAMSRQRLLVFYRQFRQVRAQVNPVNRSDFRSEAGNLSEDCGNDFAAWVVCRGRAFWTAVHRHPESFQSYLDQFFQPDPWNVRPDYVACNVFSERFNEEILDVLSSPNQHRQCNTPRQEP